MKYKVAIITGTPDWHRPEFYQKMAIHPRIDLNVYFCSRQALNGRLLYEAFRVTDGNWGINLLKGYKYKILRNYSPRKPTFGRTKLFSHVNLGICAEIRKKRYDAVIITMWNDITYWIAAITCKLLRIPFLFAGDSTILTEENKPLWKRKLKQYLLGELLFPMASGCLYRSELNRQFYRYYGVPDDRLFFYPLSVDYERYFTLYQRLRKERGRIRAEEGLSDDTFVILFVGRLSEEKRPFDLLRAYQKVESPNKALLIVGDGKLKRDIESYIKYEGAQDVHLLGFKPRPEVPKFYIMADVLVLPSSYEPHGDVVKEGMCFGLPVIVSDKVGASVDLVKHDENGFIYPCGDTEALTLYLNLLANDSQKRKVFGEASLRIIKNWDHNKAIDGLIQALDYIYKKRNE